MLKLNKKYHFLAIILLIGFGLLFFLPESTQALGIEVQQVKTIDSPAVYFLSHKNQRRKVYLNPAAYLSYGNQWSDIKVISAAELAKWPAAKLVRATNSPRIYYISGNQKTLVQKPSDLINWGLAGEPILEVSETDLNQYQSNETGGPTNSGNNNIPTSIINSNLQISSEAVQGTNGSALLTNTTSNLIGVFKVKASSPATINFIAVTLAGVYNASIIEKVSVLDQNYNSYTAHVSWDSSKRQATIGFSTPLSMATGEEKVFRIFVDLSSCICANQTVRAEIKNKEAIQTSGEVGGQFPLVGTEFKILSGDDYVGQVRSQEQSLASTNLIINNGSRLVGKFNVYEDSGNEDVYLKKMVFRSQGTVSFHDWEDFRLLRDGEIIARVNTLSNRGEIIFNINYCRISDSYQAELTVLAGLKTDYNTQAQFDLQLESIWAVGKIFNFSLFSNINNLAETNTLN